MKRLFAFVLILSLLTACAGTSSAQSGVEGGGSLAASADSSALLSSSEPEPEPAPSPGILSIDRDTVPQGGVALLRVSGAPAGTTARAETDMGYTPVFFELDGDLCAYLPARYMLDPGEFSVTVYWGEEVQTLAFTVTDAGFETQTFSVPVEEEMDMSAANAEFEAATRPVKDSADPELYWDGSFAAPLAERPLRVSSSFGYTRIINGNSSRHGGVDFAAAFDTPVYAPARGRVLYSGFLTLTGHTVCIEHGFGLKTWYYHMNARSVEAGTMVEAGAQIGLVGSTGYSNGSHLHFAATVYGAFVNPMQWFPPELLEQVVYLE